MAGDLDLTRVTSFLAPNTVREYEKPTPPQTPEWEEAEFETPDVSDQKRAVLEETVSSQLDAQKGKLVIERDEETGRFVQKTVDPETGEVLEQWPEEKFLELVKSMGEAYGLLVDRNV